MEILPLLLVPIIALTALVIQGVVDVTEWIVDRIDDYRATRRARVEAELDRKQAQLRATILNLASQLGAEAHEARKALIRESYLASRDEYPPSR